MSKLVIKASKRMGELLNSSIQLDCIDSIEHVVYTPRVYSLNVSCYSDDEEIDRVYRGGKEMIQVIKVNYKDDCYAMPQYLTTRQLNKLVRDCNPKTWENFISKVSNEIAI